MVRPTLQPGEHGRVSVSARPGGGFDAVCRVHDPDAGRTRKVRRSGPTEAAAREALLEALHERMEPDAPDDRWATLGEAVSAFFSGPVPESWSAGTARSMGYARRRLDEHAAESWPVSAQRADALFGDGSRTGHLALRLLKKVRQHR